MLLIYSAFTETKQINRFLFSSVRDKTNSSLRENYAWIRTYSHGGEQMFPTGEEQEKPISTRRFRQLYCLRLPTTGGAHAPHWSTVKVACLYRLLLSTTLPTTSKFLGI